jgi:coenzyme F420-reducing hydrogenase delta subunit
MKALVERTKELFESGDVDAEAQRVNNLVAETLKKVGLDPERFGVSLPEVSAGQSANEGNAES